MWDNAGDITACEAPTFLAAAEAGRADSHQQIGENGSHVLAVRMGRGREASLQWQRRVLHDALSFAQAARPRFVRELAEWLISLAPADQHLVGGGLEGEAQAEQSV